MTLSLDRIKKIVSDEQHRRGQYVQRALKWEGMVFGEQFERPSKEIVEQEGREQIVMPTTFNTVQLGMRLISSVPKIDVPSCRATQESDEYALKRAKFLRAMYQRCNAQQQIDILDALKWRSYVRGRHAVSVLWIGDMIPKSQRKQKFPILIQPLDPLTVGVIRGPWQTVFAYVQDEEVPRWLLRQTYPDLTFQSTYQGGGTNVGVDGEDDDDVLETVIDAWWKDTNTGKTWNATIVGSEFAREPYATRYPDIPIIEGYGDTTYGLDESLRGVSILYPIEGTWEYTNRLVSQIATGMLWYFWPHIAVTNDEGAVLPEDNAIRPGETVNYPRGTHINMIQMEPNVPLANNLLQMMETVQQQSTFPGVMYGEAGGMQAGYGVNLLTQSAAGRTISFRRNLELTCEAINRLALALVEEFGGTKGLTAWGNDDKDGVYEVSLSKKEIESYYENSVKLSSQPFSDDMQKVAVLIQMKQANLISSETFRKLAPFDLPTDEERRIEIEQALGSDELKQKQLAAALIAYYPDLWESMVKGTPLEEIAQEMALILNAYDPEEYPEGKMAPMPQIAPPTPPEQMAPPPMPEGPLPGESVSGGPPGIAGPPVQPDQMNPMAGGAPLQPDALTGPQGGGIPPEMQGQLTPEMMGQMGIPPEMWAQILGDPLTQQKVLQMYAQAGPMQ